MRRRTFLGTGLVLVNASPLFARPPGERWDDAADVLEKATAAKQVDAAVLHVVQGDRSFTRHFGKATSGDAMFLLGSISKPINVTAVMSLFDQGKFQLDDHVKKFLPSFTGDGRDDVTIRHLLTHVSGLPDQLTNNNALRKQHAPLTEFAEQTIRTPLGFAPGSRYQYSSMGILLATRIGELVSGVDSLTLVDRQVFQPLGMKHSAQGLGRFPLEAMVPCQMDGAAPESGGGDPQAREWDWNSPY
jgi:CubicO group peptidase (beta-lactamase class C family)